MAAFGRLLVATLHSHRACFKAEGGRWWAECRWCGCRKPHLFIRSSEEAVLPGTEVWGLASGTLCIGAGFVLEFLMEMHTAT